MLSSRKSKNGTILRLLALVGGVAGSVAAWPDSANAAPQCVASPSGKCDVTSVESQGRQTQWSLTLADVKHREIRVVVGGGVGPTFTFDTKDVELGACIGTVTCENGKSATAWVMARRRRA